MKQVRTSLNNEQYQRFLAQREQLDESEYRFVKNAVLERMAKNGPLIQKIQKWLIEDHKF